MSAALDVAASVATLDTGADSGLFLSIDSGGRLQIGNADDPAALVLDPAAVLSLGDFMALTEAVWRP